MHEGERQVLRLVEGSSRRRTLRTFDRDVERAVLALHGRERDLRVEQQQRADLDRLRKLQLAAHRAKIGRGSVKSSRSRKTRRDRNRNRTHSSETKVTAERAKRHAVL